MSLFDMKLIHRGRFAVGAAFAVDVPAADYVDANNFRDLFITDGAAMASSACQNPSLTYMALTARAATFAASQLKQNKI